MKVVLKYVPESPFTLPPVPIPQKSIHRLGGMFTSPPKDSSGERLAFLNPRFTVILGDKERILETVAKEGQLKNAP